MQTSIINYSETKEAGRIDAEFYHPKYNISLNKINKHNISPLYEICKNKYTNMPKNKNTIEWEYLEIDNVFLNMNSFETKNLKIGDEIPSRAAKIPNLGSIIVSTVRPTRGAICILNNIPPNLVVSSGFCVLSSCSSVNMNYLFVLLSSKPYIQLYERITKASMYPAMSEKDFLSLPIPIFSEPFQKEIENMVLKAHAKREEAIKLTKEANELLEKELGLHNFTLPKNTINTRIINYSETKKANRIDAEFYQEKYDIIINKIKSYKGGFKSLGDISKIQKGIEPGSDKYSNEGIPFIRIANLTPYELSLSNAVKVSEDFYNKNEKYQPKKGEILLSKDGTAGIAYYLHDEPDKMIPSGGILRLEINRDIIRPEVLSFILNSRSVSEQVKQTAGGAIILHWRMADIINTVIPIIDKNIQNDIANKINLAFKARIASKTLLENAKAKVEYAIENGE